MSSGPDSSSEREDALAHAFLAGYSGIDPGPVGGARERLRRFTCDVDDFGLAEAKARYREQQTAGGQRTKGE